MTEVQPGLLAAVPALARYLSFSVKPGADIFDSLGNLRDRADGDRTVAGLGSSAVLALGRDIEELKAFPSIAGTKVDMASAPAALWCA